ncbi:MAG: Clp protease N-terminal domain-containing protein [Actinomycetota bacterium]|nr:Clp protease N-terminal domain-containing protein [Actinomycetota bacterium]
MFERFTHASRDVVIRSRGAALDLGHGRIGTEHLLLGLLEAPTPVGRVLADVGVTPEVVVARVERERRRREPDLDADRRALASLGIDLDRVQDAVDESFGEGTFRSAKPVVVDGPRGRAWRRLRNRLHRRNCDGGRGRFSPRAKKVLELSLREAIRLRHRRIEPEHVALGILRDGGGMAALVLADHGLCFDALRSRLIASLDDAVQRPRRCGSRRRGRQGRVRS